MKRNAVRGSQEWSEIAMDKAYHSQAKCTISLNEGRSNAKAIQPILHLGGNNGR